MQPLVAWLVARPQNAVMVLAATLLLPVLQIFSGIFMVILVLKQGVRPAIFAGAMAAVLLAIVSLLAPGASVAQVLLSALTVWLPAVLLAVTVQATRSLNLTLQVSALLAAAAVLGFLLTWFVPVIGGGFVGSLLGVFFSFFFAVVSGRMVGLVGASNNPVSGMTIATLLIVTTVLKLLGNSGDPGIKTALMIGGVVCVAIAVAGGTAQSLKTTFIIGGTPRNVQIGMFAALSIASIAAAGTLILLNTAYGIGDVAVPAPQATLMKMIVQGIMTAKLPWTLVFIGVALAVFCFMAKIPILAVALGIYLPIGLTAAIFAGGIVRDMVERKTKITTEDEDEDKDKDNAAENEKAFEKGKDVDMDKAVEKGILLASGLVAGDALIGIVIGIFAAMGTNIAFGLTLFPGIAKSNLLAFIMFLLLSIWIFVYATRKDQSK